MIPERTCPVCSTVFVPIGLPKKIYCRSKCKIEAERKKIYTRNPHRLWPTSPSTVGAIHELEVCADLLKRGFDVFRSVSPNCSCDIVVIFNKQFVRVEVTTGSRSGTGRISAPGKNVTQFDTLAIVIGGQIEYQPSLASLGLQITEVDKLSLGSKAGRLAGVASVGVLGAGQTVGP